MNHRVWREHAKQQAKGRKAVQKAIKELDRTGIFYPPGENMLAAFVPKPRKPSTEPNSVLLSDECMSEIKKL